MWLWVPYEPKSKRQPITNSWKSFRIFKTIWCWYFFYSGQLINFFRYFYHLFLSRSFFLFLFTLTSTGKFHDVLQCSPVERTFFSTWRFLHWLLMRKVLVWLGTRELGLWWLLSRTNDILLKQFRFSLANTFYFSSFRSI